VSPVARFLVVRLGERRLGIMVEHLIAVEILGAVHPVPAGNPACHGVTLCRDRLMPVLDLATLVHGTAGGGDTAVVLRTGSRHCCLVVHEAEAVVAGDVLPVPPGESLAWAAGVVRRPEGLVPLLDTEAIMERLIPAETP